MKYASLLAMLAIVAGCSIPPPRAPELEGPPTRVVYFDDLDLTDPAAPRRLYERIQQAAVEVCGSVRAHDVAQIWVRPCVQRALTQAVSDVNNLHLQDGSFVLDSN